MTIFSVLKYPLSYPPTVAELRALPHQITDKMSAIGLGRASPATTEDRLIMYLSQDYIDKGPACKDYSDQIYNRLKQYIYEYDGV